MSQTGISGPNGSPLSSGIAPRVIEQLIYERPSTSFRPLATKVATTFLVSAYRLLSVGVLSAILLGLISYLVLTLFYFLSQGWIEPRIISPTDDRVLQLNNALVQGTLVREQLATQRIELLVKIRDARRQATDSTQFQREIQRTAEQLVSDNLHKLNTVQDVDHSYQSEAPTILDSQKSFAATAASEADRLYKLHLINEQEWISRKAQLAQMGVSSLSLQHSSAELDAEKSFLQREIDSFGHLLHTGTSDGAGLSYDGLQARREFESSLLNQARAQDLASALSEEAQILEGAMARQDRLLLNIHNLPYMKAAEEQLTVAFVPYGNADHAKSGRRIYGCSFGVLFCRPVGQVAELLEGEVIDKHPFFNKDMRGLLVRIELDDSKWNQNQVLFLEKAPLFF